ncbi:hypothetical protein [Kribbella sp. VKM Ac-2568]|uniref:hypothetical protein n=1 Tax=Kribbella sp. VKM Ac-2568 TaxID=2512219 RepID=UPI001052268D|nr:hypothetical protein [Kribbella sp. VKM Ac-2568]TCM40369.1 hypothetical protein EV648_113192 [Kribbella sp. VKM Ac-2568]
MRTVFRAVAEPVGTRTAYRNEVVADRLAGLDIRLDDLPDARDELVVGDVGPLQVVVRAPETTPNRSSYRLCRLDLAVR